MIQTFIIIENQVNISKDYPSDVLSENMKQNASVGST